MKNRQELAKYFAGLGFKVGAEVGVYEGYYSEVLLKNIPGLKLYCIDPWDDYKTYRSPSKGITFESIYKTAKERLKHYNCELIKDFSMNAVKNFKDESLDFVYLDGNHAYEFVCDDIREWAKKVRKGGIVAGHDYYVMKSGNDGVIRAVDEYVKENGYKFQRTKIDRSNPYRDDRQPSWYFIKQ